MALKNNSLLKFYETRNHVWGQMSRPLELYTNTSNTGRNFYSVASKAAYYSTSGGPKEGTA